MPPDMGVSWVHVGWVIGCRLTIDRRAVVSHSNSCMFHGFGVCGCSGAWPAASTSTANSWPLGTLSVLLSPCGLVLAAQSCAFILI